VGASTSANVAAPTGTAGDFAYNLVSVVYQDGTPACSNNISGTATVTVRPTPTASISGTATVCQGGTAPIVTFTNPQTLPITVTYNINGGTSATINVGANTTATLNVPTSTAGTFNYNIVSAAYQAGPTCAAPPVPAQTATITVRATPTATISGNATVCEDGTSPNITFSNPQALPVMITYNINGGTNTTVNVGASTTATVAAPTGTPGTFAYNLVSVVYQDGTPACSNNITGTATVIVRPTPTATISGTTSVCQGGSSTNITFTNPQALAITVTYNINGGTNTTIPVGANTTASVVAPAGTSGIFNYNLVNVAYQIIPACTNPVTGTATVTVNPRPTSVISGSQTICNGINFI
jgi:NADPH-dependent 7-cyano-7-deazaguanine reductase QueF